MFLIMHSIHSPSESPAGKHVNFEKSNIEASDTGQVQYEIVR